MVKYLPVHANVILDVGCGVGNFLNNFKSKNKILIGVEPNYEAATSANLKTDKCYNAFFDFSLVEKMLTDGYRNKFDAIFFNDVLEHMENPWIALENCKSLLSKN